MIDRIRSCLEDCILLFLFDLCMYLYDGLCLKEKKETKMFMYEFPGYKKQKILELKHFNIFVSELLKLFVFVEEVFKSIIKILQEYY